MKKGIAKLSLFFLAAGMVFGNASAAVSADEAAAGENSGAQSPAGTIGFVDLEQADFTVNVRSAADVETGEVVGILKNHDSVVIKKVTADGWYKIKSGDVKGYVAAYLIATGERADQIAAETAYRYATVQAAELNVRTSPDADGEVMCVLKEGDQAEIVASSGDWLKVCLAADSYGYIAGAYVETDVDYPTGRTIQQYEDELEGREAAWAAAPAEGKSEEEAPYAAAVAADSSAEAVYTEAAAPAETAPAQEAAAAATEVVSGGYVYTKEGDQAYTDSASSEIYTGETESYYEILGDGEPPAESYQVEADQGYEYYSEDAPAYEESAAADSSYAETGSDGSYSDGSYAELSYSGESSGEVVYLDEDYSDGSYNLYSRDRSPEQRSGAEFHRRRDCELCAAVCRQSLCMGRHQPDTGCGLLGIHDGSICPVRRDTPAFCGGSVFLRDTGKSGQPGSRRPDFLQQFRFDRSCRDLHRRRFHGPCREQQVRHYHLQYRLDDSGSCLQSCVRSGQRREALFSLPDRISYLIRKHRGFPAVLFFRLFFPELPCPALFLQYSMAQERSAKIFLKIENILALDY